MGTICCFFVEVGGGGLCWNGYRWRKRRRCMCVLSAVHWYRYPSSTHTHTPPLPFLPLQSLPLCGYFLSFLFSFFWGEGGRAVVCGGSAVCPCQLGWERYGLAQFLLRGGRPICRPTVPLQVIEQATTGENNDGPEQLESGGGDVLLLGGKKAGPEGNTEHGCFVFVLFILFFFAEWDWIGEVRWYATKRPLSAKAS